MDFKLFFLLMWTSLQSIQGHGSDFALLENIAAAGKIVVSTVLVIYIIF